MATRLRWIGTYAHGPGFGALNGSFFWRQLIKIHYIFQISTFWIIGNGMRIAYWYDNWVGAPKYTLGSGQPPPQQPHLSLCDAKSINLLIDPDDSDLHNLVVKEEDDQLVWKWGSRGIYTAGSLYKAMVGIGKIQWPFMRVWTSRVPPTVRVFTTLMLRDKILTHEVMNRRGMHCDMNCILCVNCPIESTLHLLFPLPICDTCVVSSVGILGVHTHAAGPNNPIDMDEITANEGGYAL